MSDLRFVSFFLYLHLHLATWRPCFVADWRMSLACDLWSIKTASLSASKRFRTSQFIKSSGRAEIEAQRARA